MKKLTTAHRIRTRGFSLVEVAMAMGIASFCLLATVGLLPVGLDSIRVSREESGAANCLEQIARSLRSATPNSAGGFHSTGGFGELSWSGATGGSATFDNLSLDGLPADRSAEARLIGHVEISPIGSAATGQAMVTVAWPTTATWNTSTKRWENAQGSVTTWVVFRSDR